MGNYESARVIPRVLIEATRQGWRLFRNSVGLAWQGQITEERTLMDKSRPCHMVELINARRVSYGLAKGSSDLVGWRPLVITADMVGQTIAQFVSIECKTQAYGKTTEEQDNWLEQIAQVGGYAAVARESRDGKAVDITPIESD